MEDSSTEPRELGTDDLAFLQSYVADDNVEALKEHVYGIWRAVRDKLWVYSCIQNFRYLQPRINHHPFYETVIHGAVEKPDQVLLLDVGCCFGTDTRKLVLDGFPAEKITAIDIIPDYWTFGYELFKDKNNFAAACIFGSLTDEAFVSPTDPNTPTAHLVGQAKYVWAGAVLHVLSKDDVERFVKSVWALLAPGGIFFGTTNGAEVAGEWWQTPDGKSKRYLHSMDTLTGVFKDAGFAKVDVTQRARRRPGQENELQWHQNQENGSARHEGRMTQWIFTVEKGC